MKRRVNRNRPEAKQRHDGFTLLQAMIVLTVAMIVSGATVLSIRAGRPGVQLANSAHQLAGYLERARADSVRRRPTPGQESSVQVLDTRTYRVTMGFGGSGTLSSRDFTLDGEVVFITDPTTVAFDWRGRPTTGTETTFALQNESGTIQVDVTGSGDVTVGSEIYQDEAISDINLNENVSGDVAPDPRTDPPGDTATPTPPPETDQNPTPPVVDDNPTPSPTATPKGNGNGGPHSTPTPTPTPTPYPSPSPSPSPSPGPAGCVPTISIPSFSIKKNGGSRSVTIELGGHGGEITSSAVGNLTISPAKTTVTPGQTATFTITSNNITRGIFTVTFTTPCGPVTTVVTVTN